MLSNIETLTTIFVIIIIVILILLAVLAIVYFTTKNKKEKKEERIENGVNKAEANKKAKTFAVESVMDFMEFDRVEDNMIVQKNGAKYIMVVECQGINYDLMSEVEKNGVEEGFIQFLNTLRHPIQIYVQTRTVNLGASINTYKERVDDISKQYATKQMEYNQKARSGQYTEKELSKEKYELVRQRNLYEYGVDIINNTERMSLNKNILSKHYYVIIPYYPEEASTGAYQQDEITSLAFSELYTKAQSIISSLAVCGINSKILDSTELAELLYVAYNRDESEIFNLRRALNAGYEDMYSTAPDVLDKRMKELDIKIEQDAIKKANETIYDVIEENEKQKRAKRKEEELDKLIDQMAKALIEENKRAVGADVAEAAIEKIDKDSKKKTKEEKGGEEDGKKTKTTRRKSTRSI